MTNNLVRKALLERSVTLGTWIQIGNPAVSEILADAGFDWIAADCEHTDIAVEAFTGIARGMYGRGPVPFARVCENDVIAIRQALDVGAMGVIVPLVNTAGEAAKAVQAAKYPPQGIRGYAFSRANGWGTNFDEYSGRANDDVAVVVMIETKQGVGNIDEILAVDGVDGIFIGPYDLSGSFGIPGNTSDPMIRDACKSVAEACVRHRKSAGMHLVLPTEAAIDRAVQDGYTFLALGMDTVFLSGSSKALIEMTRRYLSGGMSVC